MKKIKFIKRKNEMQIMDYMQKSGAIVTKKEIENKKLQSLEDVFLYTVKKEAISQGFDDIKIID